MNQLWLMTMIALLAANVLAQDDENFLNLVRRKASDTNTRRTETDLSEEDEKMDDSSHEMSDDNLDTRKRMNNKPNYARLALGEIMQGSGSTREEIKDLSSKQCKTLRCRLRYAFESRDKDGNLEEEASQDERGADEPTKRCMAWQCKRRLTITREKILSKKSHDADGKRCIGCEEKRSLLKILKRDSSTARNLERQETIDVKRSMKTNRRCMTRECKREEESKPGNLKKRGSSPCISWKCGKRTMKRSRDSKRIISRKPEDALELFGSSRDGKCRGLECLAKRTVKRSRDIDAAKRIISRKPEDVLDLFGSSRDGKCRGLECLAKRTVKSSRDIDAAKRIISRKPEDALELFGSSRDGKCRGLECLAKRTRKDRNEDVASLSKKNKMPAGCITWDCYGKRTAANKEPVIDTLKRIISRKNDGELGLPREKCRGWECLKKRLVHGVQGDIPTKCLSWDCDMRRDSGEITLEKHVRSTKTQENMNRQLQEKDASQYGIPDEYKDMIQKPIRRDALYVTDRGSRRSLGKDIQK